MKVVQKGGSSIDRGNSRGRGGFKRKNLAPRFDVTSRGGTYLESVIPNGEIHGITIGKKNYGFTLNFKDF